MRGCRSSLRLRFRNQGRLKCSNTWGSAKALGLGWDELRVPGASLCRAISSPAESSKIHVFHRKEQNLLCCGVFKKKTRSALRRVRDRHVLGSAASPQSLSRVVPVSGSSFTWWLERQILQRFVDTSVFVAQLSNSPHFAPNYLHGIEESKLATGAQLREPAVKGWLSPRAGGGITQAADSSFPGLKC